MVKTSLEEKVKKHFEANMLDGDNVEDCGNAMLSAKSVLEYVIDFAKSTQLALIDRVKEKFSLEDNKSWNNMVDEKLSELRREIGGQE